MTLFRRDLRLHWDREHDVASLFLTDRGAAVVCVDAREVGNELVLHYDPEGRCVEAQFLSPLETLDGETSAEAALRAAFELLATPQPPDEAG